MAITTIVKNGLMAKNLSKNDSTCNVPLSIKSHRNLMLETFCAKNPRQKDPSDFSLKTVKKCQN